MGVLHERGQRRIVGAAAEANSTAPPWISSPRRMPRDPSAPTATWCQHPHGHGQRARLQQRARARPPHQLQVGLPPSCAPRAAGPPTPGAPWPNPRVRDAPARHGSPRARRLPHVERQQVVLRAGDPAAGDMITPLYIGPGHDVGQNHAVDAAPEQARAIPKGRGHVAAHARQVEAAGRCAAAGSGAGASAMPATARQSASRPAMTVMELLGSANPIRDVAGATGEVLQPSDGRSAIPVRTGRPGSRGPRAP